MQRKIEFTGLTEKQVQKSRETYGTNELTPQKKDSFLGLLLQSLGDPIIKILLIALAIKTVFLMKSFDWYETIGIVIAIFLASFISTISEYGSEKAFEKLQEDSAKLKCRVKRNGKIVEVSMDEIVVGDLVLLEAGDKIPADGRMIEGEITVDESALNGETKEARKKAISHLEEETEENLVYRGTVVYSKKGMMQVNKVGDQTFYGALAKEIQEKQPDSPLKLRLRGLATIISKIGYVGAVLVSISYLFSVVVIENHFQPDLILKTVTNFPLISGHILYALTLSVTIIVVAVPEGLPMMITLVLSSNMKRMLKSNVLVRKLIGIETAGNLNILFTDKTGTLTKGKLEVICLMDGKLREYQSISQLNSFKNYQEIVKDSLYYNNASSYDESKKEVIGGNITDRSLMQFIVGNFPEKKRVVSSLPFDSKNKYSMASIEHHGQVRHFVKGAPEKLLPQCTEYYDEDGKKRRIISIQSYFQRLKQITSHGIRVLVLAESKNGENITTHSNLTLIGIILIKDEVREEAKEGIELVQRAHIQTVMITGDNKETAISIAKEVGLIQESSDIVLTSQELNQKSDEELKKILPHLRVVARSLPQDKSRLVRISQEMNLVVGMTGDGVNDAPALKKADVGFAMGSGTEVSKEASDIVILDDNFKSISQAILFGRTIFKSIRKFIIFQLTVNICAVSLSIIGPFIGVDTPVTVIQMLWINMVMDTLAGIAFAYEPPLLEYMDEEPKKKNEPIINTYMKDEIIFTGAYSALLCVLFLKSPWIHHFFRSSIDNRYLMTAFFGLFIFMGIFNSFNARTHRLNLLAHLYQNRIFIVVILFILFVQVSLIYFGGSLFRTFGLTLYEFVIMLLFAVTVVPVDWFRKLYLRKKGIIGGV